MQYVRGKGGRVVDKFENLILVDETKKYFLKSLPHYPPPFNLKYRKISL